MSTLRATPAAFAVGTTTTLAYTGSTGGSIRITNQDGSRTYKPTTVGDGQVTYRPTAPVQYRADLLSHRPPKKSIASTTFVVQAPIPAPPPVVVPPPVIVPVPPEPPPVVVVPPPPPPPAGARRFVAPVTVRTVTLPPSIDATGATEVRGALMTFFAQVPNGSVIDLPVNGTFKIASSFGFIGRRHLVIEGHGSKLVMASAGNGITDSLLDFYNAGDIAIRQLGLVGGNPNPGRLIYGQEDRAHAVRVHRDNDDGQPNRLEFDRCWSSNTWGDFIQLDGETFPIWPDSVWVHDGEVKDAGRSAWSILAARNFWFERMRIGNCGLQHHNVEPYRASGGADNVHILDNVSYGKFNFDVVGTYAGGLWFACNHPAASFSNIFIRGNTIERQVMQIGMTVGSSRNVFIEDNTSLFQGYPLYGASGVINVARITGGAVRRNTQPLTSGKIANLVDCAGVVIV